MDDVRKLVKVKPLEWRDWSAKHRVIVVAPGYTITQRHFPDMHFIIERLEQNPLPPSDTLEAAKAAAQADYEARIYAALIPASDGRADGLREAAAWHEAQITELDEQIARNDRYRKETGRLGQVSEANEYCRTLIANHRLSRDVILARIKETSHD